jgi:AAA domain-containing protein
MNRMSLANVKRGRLIVPPKVMIYGIEGVGKSTFAAGAPKPLFVPFDSRTSHLDVARLPKPDTWEEACDAMRMLADEKHGYETIVIDPVNWLESILHEHVCLANGWKAISDPGYGKGPDAAQPHWRVFLSLVERVWAKGMGIVLIAHAQVKTFNNPEGSSFDRYEPALDKRAGGLLKQWCDHVLFAREQAATKVAAKGDKAKGVSTGYRMMHTTWHAAYDAKFSGSVSPTLPLSWAAFSDALDGSRRKLSELRTQIAEQAKKLDATTVAKIEKYVADAGDDVDRLAEIANVVSVKVREIESEEEHEST